MSAFLRLSARLPITAASAGKRVATSPAFVRFNSSSSTSRAAQVIEIAAQAEKPSAMETAVPLMWATTGVLAFAAWNRIDEKTAEGNVEKLLIV